MLFNTIDFAIFFPIVFLIYWIVSKHLTIRNVFLLIVSYVFYGWWDWRFLFLIAFSSIVDYVLGIKINSTENRLHKKLYLVTSLIVNLGLLCYFKYTNFFIDSFVSAFNLFGNSLASSTLNIILPVGISFYTFQTLSYTIDIYRGNLQPTKNIISFFTFVAFFPQLVAGPIERASHLLPQFSVIHKFNYRLVKSGALLILFGLFKKMVIADRLAILVNQVYNNPTDYYGFEVILATVFFAFQIYCDFSGYSDIAIGSARMLGFDLMQNFNHPYFAKSIKEFWRRWHISLSSWFRDYVYIPLGGSKKGKFRTYLNLFYVFLISGLWHGAAMTFIIWGAIHGAIQVIENYTSNVRSRYFLKLGLNKDNFSTRIFFTLITFSIVCFAWIFFRANNLESALILIRNGSHLDIHSFFFEGIYTLGLSISELLISLFFILILIVMEFINERKNAIVLISSQGFLLRYSIYLIVIINIIIFGIYGEMAPKEFIYFQF